MDKKIITILLCLLLVVTGCSNADLAASVNGDKITKDQLSEKVADYQKTMESSGLILNGVEDEEYQAILQTEVLNLMIREVLLHQALEEKGIEVSSTSAEEYVATMKEMYGEEEFAMILEANGLDEETFIADFAFNEALDILRTKVTADLIVDETEAKAHFETNKDDYVQGQASHILVQFNTDIASEEEDEENLKKAEAILARLKAGEDFATVAKETSDDTSAANGGKLDGTFSMLNSPFVDVFTLAALSLDEGEYTEEPVKSQFGYHIIRLDEKIDDYETLADGVRDQLLSEKKTNFFFDYIEKLREQADIEIFIEALSEDEGELPSDEE